VTRPFLSITRKSCRGRWAFEGTFTYGKRYLERPEVVALDPFHLPLSTRPQRFTKLKGIPGAVRDASPDAWGRRVIQAKLQRPEADIFARIVSLIDPPTMRLEYRSITAAT